MVPKIIGIATEDEKRQRLKFPMDDAGSIFAQIVLE